MSLTGGPMRCITTTAASSPSPAQAGVQGPAKEWSSGCTFLDYDRDGHLDLFVTSYQQFDPATTPLPGKGSNCEWKGMPVFCGPRGLPFGAATLYRNRGDGTFEDASLKSGIRQGKGFLCVHAGRGRPQQDGWIDHLCCLATRPPASSSATTRTARSVRSRQKPGSLSTSMVTSRAGWA